MTTPTQTAETRRTRTTTTELVCLCGKKLKVTIPRKHWLVSLIATALASRWKIEQNYDVKLADTIDAYCPNCWGTNHLQ